MRHNQKSSQINIRLINHAIIFQCITIKSHLKSISDSLIKQSYFNTSQSQVIPINIMLINYGIGIISTRLYYGYAEE